MHVVLVSCTATKLPHAAPAHDLYCSPWFKAARVYAERHGSAWAILSAKYGLVLAHRVIGPYEQTLTTATAAERRQWAERVARRLARIVPPGTRLTILAGRAYTRPLLPLLDGFAVATPLARVSGIGMQINWLRAHT